MDKKEIVALEKEIKPVVAIAAKVIIKTADDMVKAAETLSLVNRYADQVKAKRETLTKPMNEALKNARALFKPLESQLEEAIDSLREAMSDYQTAETLRVLEEEARIAARIGQGKGKIKLETAIRKVGEVDRAEASVSTRSGTVKFRKDQVLEIVDMALIPKEYFVINESLLLADLKAGKVVPGARVGVKMVPLNYRNDPKKQ